MGAGLGKLLIAAGVALIVLGVLLQLGGRIPWIGRLPGDIFVRRDGFAFYFPITTSILVSIILSLIVWLLRR